MAGRRAARLAAVMAVAMTTVLAMFASTIEASPRQPTRDEVEPPAPPCANDASWSKLKACLGHTGVVVTVLYEVPGAKVVSVRGKTSFDFVTLSLYMLRDRKWRQMSVSTALTPLTEVLSFTRKPKAPGYQLQIGSVMQTTAALDRQTRVPVLLRRQLTTFCFDNGSCQSVYTSCDALIDGKTYWTFHAALSVDHGLLRVSGDDSRAGQVCAPSRSTFTSELLGDPLE